MTPSRRGRPRSSGSGSDLEPREEILVAAARLFSGRGIGAIRMADIARAVGVTPASIYYHFDNREAIVEALLEYVVDESAAFATASAGRPGPCAERLRELLHQHISRLASGPYDLWFVAGISGEDTGRFHSVSTKAVRWRRAVSRLVAEGAAAGEFAPVEPALAVSILSGIVYGALERRHRGGEVDAALVATLAVGALRPDPACPTERCDGGVL
jgi:AcrR family transcriptional regulator